MAPPIPRRLALVVVLLLMGRIIAYTPTTATASPAASTRARASIRGAIPCTPRAASLPAPTRTCQTCRVASSTTGAAKEAAIAELIARSWRSGHRSAWSLVATCGWFSLRPFLNMAQATPASALATRSHAAAVVVSLVLLPLDVAFARTMHAVWAPRLGVRIRRRIALAARAAAKGTSDRFDTERASNAEDMRRAWLPARVYLLQREHQGVWTAKCLTGSSPQPKHLFKAFATRYLRTIQWSAAALSFSATSALIWIGISALSLTFLYGPSGVPGVLAKWRAAYEASTAAAASTAAMAVA